MTPAQTMLRAAQLLNEDADLGKESCMVGDRVWACPDCTKDEYGRCAAKAAYDTRQMTAASLIVLAKALQP